MPKNTLAFVTSPRPPLVEEEEADVTGLEDPFIAASENGFMLSRGDEAIYITPRAQACLAF